MLNQYKNINQIQVRTKSVSGERISKSKTEFLDFDDREYILIMIYQIKLKINV
jgi:hypothetical protein